MTKKNIELTLLLLILIVYSLLSFVSLDWFAVFVDEPGYTDPAANFLLGHGFTSGAWYAQGCDEFWAGNVPLHQFLLYAWMKCFGFNLVAVRSVNIIYVIIGITAVWSGIKRLELIQNSGMRLMAVSLLLASHSGAIWVNVGRPDSICFAISGLLLWSGSFLNPILRRSSLAILALTSVWAGIPLALVIGFIGLSLFIFLPRRYAIDVIFLAFGGLLGATSLIGFYLYHGVFDSFIQSILPHSSLLGKPSHFTPPPVAGLKHRLGGYTDYTYLCLIVTCGITWLSTWKTKSIRPWLASNIISLFGIPLLLFSVGLFPIYYSWFSYLPTLLTLFGLWERVPSLASPFRIMISLSLCAILPLGFIRVWLNGFIYRHDQINCRTEEFIASVLKPQDVVLCQAQPWYAAKKKAKRVYQGFKTPNLTASEESEITVVICNEKFFHAQREILKGEWKETGEKLSLPNRNTHRLPFSQWFRDNPTIDLHVFRRVHH